MKTSKKDFDLFKEESHYWVHRFGLLNWEFAYIHGKTDEDARADCGLNHSARIATITLDTDWLEMDVNHETICKTAFHETMEVKYGPLAKLLVQFYNEDLVFQFVHDLIRTDETAVFQPYYSEKYGD